MKQFTIMGILCLWGLCLSAQRIEKKFLVHFALNSFELDADAEKSLKEVIDLSKQTITYKLTLDAHTDESGSNQYNQRLSENRKGTVYGYLVNKGITETSFLDAKAWGEAKPIIKTARQTETLVNRRVEITVTGHILNSVLDLEDLNRENERQFFTINTNEISLVEGKAGTRLIVPENAFVDADGNAVKGTVNFELKEFMSFGASILNGLTTISDGKILESGGMVFINATADGKPLSLKEGKNITIQIPAAATQTGMSVFTGNKDNNGLIVWTNTEDQFKPVVVNTTPKLPMPGFWSYLESLRLPIKFNGVTKTNVDALSSIKIPRPEASLTKPIQPVPPKEPIAPQSKQRFKLLANKEWRQYYRDEKRYNAAMTNFNKRKLRYERNIARYNSLIILEKAEAEKYDATVNAYFETLDKMLKDREARVKELRDSLRIASWNGTLNTAIKKMKDSVYYQTDLSGRLKNGYYYYNPKSNYAYFLIEKYLSEMRIINYLKSISSEQAFAFNGKRTNLNADRFNYSKIRNYNLTNYMSYGNGIQSKELPEIETRLSNPETMARLSEIAAFVANKKIELGIFDERDVARIYEASVSGMGYINCDRFSDTPPKQMAKVKVNGPAAGDRVLICIHRLNSVLPLSSGLGKSYSVDIPKGEKISIIVTGVVNGKPALAIREAMTWDDGMVFNMYAQPMELDEFTAKLASLK